MEFKSTYPKEWKPSNKERKTEDSYTRLNIQKETIDIIPGQIAIGKSVDPIGMVDVFSEKLEVIKEYRKPSKMPTLGEMKAIWTNFNQELYNSVISQKYINA